LGRLDHQVKLRGLRIELGEIVVALKQHPAVKEAVALVREDKVGDKHLVAYIVPGQEPPPAAGELRDFLKKTLPDYMVPSFFVALESLPLTPNGKVDRRSLPAPDTTRRAAGGEFVAPRDAVEEVVAGVWAEVLHLERVSVTDNFFDLGGHSLLATQIVSRLQSSFSVELPLRHMFEAPTVSGLARRLEAVGGAAHVDVLAVAGVLVKVSRLSDDEVRSVLAEKSGRHSET
jgi:acyl carrier protein